MARSPTQFSSAAERERKLAEAKKNRGSESRGYDLTPAAEKAKAIGRDLKTRSDRAYLAGISAMGAGALGASGAVGKVIGHKDASGDLTRARGALKDVGKFAKAAVMGEPKGEKYLKGGEDGPMGSLGRYYMRGSDVDWEKKEPKKKATGGKVQTSSDTARKLATEMGGMKKGGKPKSGLAVMIAIGEAKKPVKKAVGGAMSPQDRALLRIRDRQQQSAPAPRERVMNPKARAMVEAAADKGAMGAPRTAIGRPIPMPNVAKVQYKDGGSPVKKAVGGTGKMRKGMCDKPTKLAKGGAGKVRKGMMTPEGKIIDVMNKIRGK